MRSSVQAQSEPQDGKVTSIADELAKLAKAKRPRGNYGGRICTDERQFNKENVSASLHAPRHHRSSCQLAISRDDPPLTSLPLLILRLDIVS